MSNYQKPSQFYTQEAYLQQEVVRLHGVINDYIKRLEDSQDQNRRVFRFLHTEGLVNRYIAWQVAQRLEEE